MGGGSVQLQAYGAMDKKLTGNPQMSYFPYVYKRHTNFAIETREEVLDLTSSVGEQTTIKTIVASQADLMYKAHVQIKFTASTTMDNQGTSTNYLSFTNNTGHAFVKEVSILIQDQEIDKHYSEWFDIWSELTDPNEIEHLPVNKHVGKNIYYKSIKNPEADVADQEIFIESDDTLTCYVPLKFWFTKNPGLALPLLCLYHHTVKFKFVFRKMDALFNSNTTFSNPTTAPDVKLYIDYILLDEDERRKFITDNKHTYLITQLQRHGPQQLTNIHDLVFNHPVKEIVWVCRNQNAGTEGSNPAVNGASFDGASNLSSATADFGGSWNNNDFFNYSSPDRSILTEVVGGNKSYEPFTYATLLLNGIERFTKRRPSYFRITQPMNYHSKVPSKHIYVYSFALKPEEHQPSGTCNFSVIQKAQLKFDAVSGTGQQMDLIVFAVNYNQLCIMDGMGGLRFST